MVWDKNNNQISTVTTPTEPTTYTDQGVDFLKFTFDKNNYIKFQNKEGVFSTNILENRFGTWDKNKIKMKTYNRSNENQINLFIEFETIDDKKSKLKVEINLNVDRTNGDYDLVENIDLSFDSGKIEGKETRFNKELTDSKKHGICSTYSKKF
jgi:hypothetical protein